MLLNHYRVIIIKHYTVTKEDADMKNLDVLDKDVKDTEKRAKNRERVAKYREKHRIALNGKFNENAKSRLDMYVDYTVMQELTKLAEYLETTKKELIETLIKDKFEQISKTYEYKEFLRDPNYRVTIDKQTGQSIFRKVKN